MRKWKGIELTEFFPDPRKVEELFEILSTAASGHTQAEVLDAAALLIGRCLQQVEPNDIDHEIVNMTTMVEREAKFGDLVDCIKYGFRGHP